MPYPHSVWDIFTSYTTLGYWIPGSLWYDWYVPAIVALYIFFPVLFYGLKRNLLLSLIFIIPMIMTYFDYIHLKWFYNCLWYRLDIFILGAASFYLMNKTICGHKSFFILAIGIICPFIYAYTDILNTNNCIIDKILFDIVLFCSMLAICQLLRFNMMNGYINKILVFMGSISLEFYLLHQQLMRIMKTVSNKIIELPDYITVLIAFTITLILAVIIQRITNTPYLKSSKKEKKQI